MGVARGAVFAQRTAPLRSRTGSGALRRAAPSLPVSLCVYLSVYPPFPEPFLRDLPRRRRRPMTVAPAVPYKCRCK